MRRAMMWLAAMLLAVAIGWGAASPASADGQWQDTTDAVVALLEGVVDLRNLAREGTEAEVEAKTAELIELLRADVAEAATAPEVDDRGAGSPRTSSTRPGTRCACTSRATRRRA